MPKLQDFRVEFDRPGATFVPGETVSGKVILCLSGPKNVREIRLEAQGKAEVHWTHGYTVKDSSGRSHYRTDNYVGNEHYFSVSNRLVGGAAGDGQTTLPSGRHSYHFSFQLPTNIPCSVEHQYGHIRYTVKAILDRPWRFDHKVVSAFTVVAPYDLNTRQSLAMGINDNIDRNFFCCCFFHIGKIKINVKMNVTGFVPGEAIELIINYDNTSVRVDLTKIKVQLQKSMTFYANSPCSETKSDSEIVRKVKKSGPFDKKGETILKLEVPPLPPSRLEHCSLIHVSYNLNLKFYISGIHFNIPRTYPIEIGTVPLYYRTTNPSQNTTPYVPSAPPIEQISPGVPQMPHSPQQIGFVVMNAPPYPCVGTSQPIPEMPPPSYEECITTGSNNITDRNEQGMHGPNVPFAPRYPVYKFPMPTPYPP